MRASVMPPDLAWSREAFKEKEILAHLEEWRGNLAAIKADGHTGITLKRARIEIDRWLDELLDVRGR